MLNLKTIEPIEHAILQRGRVDTPELAALRSHFDANPTIDRTSVDFLVRLHNRVEHRSPAFVNFIFHVVKKHLLARDLLTAEDAAWLRPIIVSGDVLLDEGRRLLRELRGEAANIDPEFDRFVTACLRRDVEPHTCG